MKRFLRDHGVLLLVLAILASLVVGICGMVFGTDPVSTVINTVATPVRSGINAVVTWVDGVYEYVFNYQISERERSDLRRQVAQLEDKVRQGEEANRENAQLRQLLGLQQKRRDFVFEAARVTARGTQGWDSTLTLARGSSAGVSVDDCVITETGVLVGVVSQVGPNWCTVDTVLSPNTEMGGLVLRANAAGILEGDLALMQQGLLRLAYLPLDSGLMAGDEVLTSGRGEVFPSGLVVGRVEQVAADDSGMASYALVRPDVQLEKLIEVFIIKEFDIVE